MQRHHDAGAEIGKAGLPAVRAGAPEAPYARPRSSTAFIAQLIATAQQLPQTCAKRRGAPADASVLYEAAQQRNAPEMPGRFLQHCS